MVPELKPCPFCGNNAKPRRFCSGILNRKVGHYVECVVCRIRTSIELDIARAAEVWNRRASEIVKVETSFYDKEETFPDCTVQVLTNTATGETSVGWWKNGE